MKKIYKPLLSGLCLTFFSISSFAESEQNDIILTLFHYEEEESEHPSKGYRTPSVPFICTIDFENHRIETTIPYGITVYELWTEDGNDLIVSYASDYDLVEYMSVLSGEFQLRLVSYGCNFVGSLDL